MAVYEDRYSYKVNVCTVHHCRFVEIPEHTKTPEQNVFLRLVFTSVNMKHNSSYSSLFDPQLTVFYDELPIIVLCVPIENVFASQFSNLFTFT